MNIGIDIDDTIADTYEKLFSYAHRYEIEDLKKQGNIIKLSNIESGTYVKEIFNWNEEEEADFFKKYYKIVLAQISPKTFAPEILKKLKQDGHKLIFITARNNRYFKDTINVTKKWFKTYKIPMDELCTDAKEKGKICKDNNIDVFIDDSFKNCKSAESFGIQTYLMDSRTNRNIDTGNTKRVYSWIQLYNKLQK